MTMNTVMSTLAASIVGLIIIVGVLAAATEPSPVLPEVSKLRLLVAYEKAMVKQKEAQEAQVALQNAIAAFNQTAEKEVAENKLAKGTTFRVNIDTGEVQVVPPPPEETKK